MTTQTQCWRFTRFFHSLDRFAKRKLDDTSFYGGVLHVCYAPEYESVDDTREKLQQRRIEVARQLRKLGQEDELLNSNFDNGNDEAEDEPKQHPSLSVNQNFPTSSHSLPTQHAPAAYPPPHLSMPPPFPHPPFHPRFHPPFHPPFNPESSRHRHPIQAAFHQRRFRATRFRYPQQVVYPSQVPAAMRDMRLNASPNQAQLTTESAPNADETNAKQTVEDSKATNQESSGGLVIRHLEPSHSTSKPQFVARSSRGRKVLPQHLLDRVTSLLRHCTNNTDQSPISSAIKISTVQANEKLRKEAMVLGQVLSTLVVAWWWVAHLNVMVCLQEAGPKLPSQIEREMFESRQAEVAHASHDESVSEIRKRVLEVARFIITWLQHFVVYVYGFQHFKNMSFRT